jgi:hypothetical protein
VRTIVAGSRTVTDYDLVADAIASATWPITVIISGGAKGVDELGEAYAYLHKIPLEVFNANWNKYGRSAGHMRNEEMAKNADALIAIWDGESRGTANMIETAKKYKLKVHVRVV